MQEPTDKPAHLPWQCPCATEKQADKTSSYRNFSGSMMTARSYTFSHAIARRPSARIIDGLRAVDTGAPDLRRFEQDHAHYVSLLPSTGAAVSVLEPLDDYPDSVFVEDAALCLPEVAIAMRPGAPSRIGEAAAMVPVLSGFYAEVIAINGPGFIDGGDILVTEREILVGRSARTDAAGIAELAQITSRWGYHVREVETPAGVLHFKTDCSLMDEETVLATARLSDTGCFDGYRVINTAGGEDAAAKWQLGYAPESWNTMTDALRKEGFSDELLLASGVVGRARTGRFYDRMRGRVVFPILDQAGVPRGFAGRLVLGDGPKYLNTPETELYQKRSLLYGIHLANEPIIDAGKAVVVEGYTDAIAAHQAGFTNVVATGGTALTPEHLEILSQITTNVTLAFDGDQAGLLAAQRTAELERTSEAVRFRVARLPEGQDPADLLAGADGNLLRDAIATALPLEHHLIDQIVQEHDLQEPESMAQAIHTATSVVAPISNAADRAEAVTFLANRIGRDEALIYAQLDVRPQQRERQLNRAQGRSLA